MKKIFILKHPKKQKDRLFEEAKRDVKKYFKREQNKALPEDFDCWEFDCKFGNTQDDAKVINRTEITSCIDGAQKMNMDSFYLEILAKPSNKPKRIRTEDDLEATV